MKLKVFTDGGSKGNPGKASIGIVIYADEKEIVAYREDIGIATNNVAEYTAVIRAFQKIQELSVDPSTEIHFNLDSLLVVSQLNGIYKIKNPTIGELVLKVKNLQSYYPNVTYTHIPREQNTKADNLVNNLL